MRLDVVANGLRHAVLEALLVRAAVARGDAVDERNDALLRRFGPKEDDFHPGAVHNLLLPDDERLVLNAPCTRL